MRKFESMAKLAEYLSTHYAIYYHAPMDVRPIAVDVVRFTVDWRKPDKSTVTINHANTGTLRLNMADHLDRFRAYS